MDPNETLALLLESIADHDSDKIFEHAIDLVTWFQGDGFVPRLAYDLSRVAKLYTNDQCWMELQALVRLHE